MNSRLCNVTKLLRGVICWLHILFCVLVIPFVLYVTGVITTDFVAALANTQVIVVVLYVPLLVVYLVCMKMLNQEICQYIAKSCAKKTHRDNICVSYSKGKFWVDMVEKNWTTLFFEELSEEIQRYVDVLYPIYCKGQQV